MIFALPPGCEGQCRRCEGQRRCLGRKVLAARTGASGEALGMLGPGGRQGGLVWGKTARTVRATAALLRPGSPLIVLGSHFACLGMTLASLWRSLIFQKSVYLVFGG